ncbi:MAG: hypothetical protein WHZ52_00995 [Armatimonadota bacterium]
MPLKYVDETNWRIRPEYLIAENIPPDLHPNDYVNLLLLATGAEMALKSARACRRLCIVKLRRATTRGQVLEALGYRDGGRFIHRTLIARYGPTWHLPLRQLFDICEERGVPGLDVRLDPRYDWWLGGTMRAMSHIVTLPWFMVADWSQPRPRGMWQAAKSISLCMVHLHRLTPSFLQMLAGYMLDLYVTPLPFSHELYVQGQGRVPPLRAGFARGPIPPEGWSWMKA